MKLISESYKYRLQQLAGINEAWGVGNTTDKERGEAFEKTNERVPYKKDLMIYAIKGGFEVGLLFKTKNEKDQMPISKYRTILPMALGTHKSTGNEVLSAFHEIGQSESKARETGRRSAEAKNEWRLFNTKNILSMWLTGKMIDKAPDGFKGSKDSRMATVEVYFRPEVAKKIQAQQGAEKEQQSSERDRLVSKGMPEPEKTPVAPVKTAPAKPIVKKEEPKTIPIKSVAPEEKPVAKTKTPTKKEPVKQTIKPTTKPEKIEKPVDKRNQSTINNKERPGNKPALKPIGYKPKGKDKELNTYPD